jgi:hypothetical protein
MVKSEFEKFTLTKDGSKINGIVERYHRTVDEMANAFYHGMMTPNFFLEIRVPSFELDL